MRCTIILKFKNCFFVFTIGIYMRRKEIYMSRKKMERRRDRGKEMESGRDTGEEETQGKKRYRGRRDRWEKV